MIKKVKWNEKLETLISEYFDYEKITKPKKQTGLLKKSKKSLI